MTGAKGSALEWALALLRAPGERHALRLRPLPADMQRLVGIAAGAMPEALAEAARSFGEPEHVVREAAQFYAREVLFFPMADAYRTLGVAPDADHEQIKLHHRLLQHWLHPDRLQSEDDAVFAGRVNTAWNLLRNDSRRSAYDQAQRDATTGIPVPESGVDERPMPAWARDAMPADAEPSRWLHRLPVLALAMTCLVLAVLAVRDADRQPDAWRERLAKVAAGTDAALDITVPERAGEPPATATGRQESSTPTPRKRDAALSRPVAATRQAAVEGAPAARAPALIAAVAPPPEVLPTRVSVPLAAPEPVSIPTAEVTLAVARMPERLAPPPRQAIASPAAAPAVVTPAPARADTPGSVSQQAPSSARIRQAQQAGGQLLRYMGDAGRPPPPIWNSPGIQSSAGQLRGELLRDGRVRLGAPEWRIGNDSASVTASFRADGANARVGSVSAQLVWRDGQWLVTGLSMERAQ